MSNIAEIAIAASQVGLGNLTTLPSDDDDDFDDLSNSPPICEKGAATWRQLRL